MMSGSVGADGDLAGEVDWARVGILNADSEEAPEALRGGKLVTSEEDASAEVLIYFWFKSNVKLQAIHVSSPSAARAPSRARLFANETNLDMNDAAGGAPPTKDFEKIEWGSPGPDGSVAARLEVNFLKFQNLGSLTVHLCREDDDGLPEEGGEPVAVHGFRLVGKA
ncbi:unnamed protein product [Prorocentrum cordatum]|uniref:PITH domain-containing protein n=1 Tax=Prorocentrum cordatum TaxID=2364126 RepID=A0ABN9TXH3_9DINO|nr:unnamed protein product [Polarella glacialis]